MYQETKSFPKEELYGLVSQMRRSAVSVATNIVEGCGRRTEPEFNRFLDIAFGSIREVGYLVDLATRLGYLNEKGAQLLGETQRRGAAALGAFIQTRETY
ncbi:MAG: four helix bundle protein [Thermoanaerobaculales bacterium]|nr:four helix bundle protein [Thermoanaerobaculales bacterium]